MNTMNKIFDYRDFKFNISVELNTIVEKRLEGKRFHKITVTGITDDYFKAEIVEDDYLELFINNTEITIKQFVDNKKDGTVIDNRLYKLGFK